MCANCGFPAAKGHWTDAGAGGAFDRVRGRLQRARILAPVLASYGLTVHDDGSGPGFILANRTGGEVVCNAMRFARLKASGRSMANEPTLG
jgi:hypothetical protein